ncbi:TIGR01777 family oxidoreductase [Flavobacterium sp.]|uniref:TIGR01777 family oxidoreductase n=1 Tax=Flavobacterium sp. TaxID=239 RepID=UPI00286CA14F|nr:TIGR01777 family oxidoreductase [Flavobacterium sp.]
MKKNVLISGGSGFVGKQLTSLLIEAGYSVSILSRTKKQNTTDISYYHWDITRFIIDEEAVLNANFIIHLAGENIAEKRWTTKRKTEILESRVQSTRLIYEVLKKNNKQLDAFISASGIGIYGAINGSEICTESEPLINDFLGITCQKWEAAADQIESLKIRTVKIRTGLVLGKNEGFLKVISPIFKYKLGSALGSGNQFMPWIHITDLCAIYLKAIEDIEMKGSYNAAINDGTTNTIFSKTLAGVYGYSMWLPNIPEFIIQTILGEMSLMVLKGRRVSSDKIEKTGFKFQFVVLEKALKDCLL